jgi:spore coat polysaccharide biosynthesis protein SpsF
MKIVTIIQARMGSSRLPGKVLKDLCGDTVLSRVVQRVRRSNLAGEVMIATTTRSLDELIVKECRRIDVRIFRGAEDDVLDRYYQASLHAEADVVVRITSDCPLIDPEVTDKTIQAFIDQSPDYASNRIQQTYPRGLDTEVMTREALSLAWREAKAKYQRTHVTPYLYENPNQFSLLSVENDIDYGNYRWTLDTPEDLAFITAVYERMGGDDFSWGDLLALLRREPELAELNQGILQKELHEC